MEITLSRALKKNRLAEELNCCRPLGYSENSRRKDVPRDRGMARNLL